MTDMFPIIQWMVSLKLAQNEFAASKIATGLKLWELSDEEAMKARVLLYRKWRPKTDKKNMLPTYQAFDLAVAGIDPADVVERQIELISEMDK